MNRVHLRRLAGREELLHRVTRMWPVEELPVDQCPIIGRILELAWSAAPNALLRNRIILAKAPTAALCTRDRLEYADGRMLVMNDDLTVLVDAVLDCTGKLQLWKSAAWLVAAN